MTFRKYGEKATEGLSVRGRNGSENGKYRMRIGLFLLLGKNDRGSYRRRSGDVSLGLPGLYCRALVSMADGTSGRFYIQALHI